MMIPSPLQWPRSSTSESHRARAWVWACTRASNRSGPARAALAPVSAAARMCKRCTAKADTPPTLHPGRYNRMDAAIWSKLQGHPSILPAPWTIPPLRCSPYHQIYYPIPNYLRTVRNGLCMILSPAYTGLPPHSVIGSRKPSINSL